MSEAQQVIRETHSEIRALQNKLEGIFIGRTARIVSNYNGQPYGCSKPSLKGHEAEIEAIYCDPTRSTPSLKLQGHDLYLGLDEVEIL